MSEATKFKVGDRVVTQLSDGEIGKIGKYEPNSTIYPFRVDFESRAWPEWCNATDMTPADPEPATSTEEQIAALMAKPEHKAAMAGVLNDAADRTELASTAHQHERRRLAHEYLPIMLKGAFGDFTVDSETLVNAALELADALIAATTEESP